MITKLDDPSMYGYIKDTGHALRNAYKERALFCDPFVDLMKSHDFKRVYLVGSSTSYNASLYIATPPRASRPALTRATSRPPAPIAPIRSWSSAFLSPAPPSRPSTSCAVPTRRASTPSRLPMLWTAP